MGLRSAVRGDPGYVVGGCQHVGRNELTWLSMLIEGMREGGGAPAQAAAAGGKEPCGLLFCLQVRVGGAGAIALVASVVWKAWEKVRSRWWF